MRKPWVKRTSTFSHHVTAAIALFTTLMTCAIVALPMDSEGVFREPAGKSSTPEATPAWTPHSQIQIDGNAGFTGPNETTGITRGSGTASDPYMIEGWEIAYEGVFGISIHNSDVHFEIRNCYVRDLYSGAPGPPTIAIELWTCSNWTVRDCVVMNVEYGLSLLDASGTLENNTCSNCATAIDQIFGSCLLINNRCIFNGYGLSLGQVRNTTLINNNCSGNSLTGIIMYFHSDNNTLINNTLSNNGEGISAELSSNNTLCNNNCSWNMGYGMYFSGSDGSNVIWNNTFRYNNGAGDTFDPMHVQAFDDASSDSWNSSDGHGNYWSDWTTPDSDSNGIVDVPYPLDGGAGAKDSFPLTTAPTEPIPEFGMIPFVVIVVLAALVSPIGVRGRKTR